MPFISINGKMLDYKDYKRQLLIIKKYTETTMKEIMKQHGFDDYLFNKELNLQIHLSFKVKGDLKVV